MTKEEKLTFKPYARLLTMLGEQLIRNERIALVELVKNSYDADATWVKISFENFGPNLEINEKESRIIIEDNGIGMSEEIIRKHWVNPATPEKQNRKLKTPRTKLGRAIQGEKGIGRFAMLKLGKIVNLYTRQAGENVEHNVSFDFSEYNENFQPIDSKKKSPDQALFLDELSIKLRSGSPIHINDNPVEFGIGEIKRINRGTRIEISHLSGKWTNKKIKACCSDLSKLQSIFDTPRTQNKQSKSHFNIAVDVNGAFQFDAEEYLEKLRFLLDERPVLKITNGRFDQDKKLITFNIDGYFENLKIKLSLTDPDLISHRVFRYHFSNERKFDGLEFEERDPECGSFSFEFYIFDFTSQALPKFRLDSIDKRNIALHRIYLYRDEIRVFPYGEPDDDWLYVGQYRGTVAAGDLVSNDQIVGKIDITHKDNPNLQDKTNREGLVEKGNATHDFFGILKGILGYLTEHQYKRYRYGLKNKSKNKNIVDIFTSEVIKNKLNSVIEALDKGEIKKAKKQLMEIQKEYDDERSHLVQRAEMTEDLAGIGLSVEVAAHDIYAVLDKALRKVDGIIRSMDYSDVNFEKLKDELQIIYGMLSFVTDQMKDVQILFSSTKKRRKNIKVAEILEKTERIYDRIFNNKKIEFKIKKIGSPLIAKTTDAVLLQVLINLLDNSIYWLSFSSKKNKKILITLDGNTGEMICSDNGPGVSSDDIPYIFEAFYSSKGEGRGLGLYIARQLLMRHDYSIEYEDLKSKKILDGANFVVSFVAGDS